VTDAFLTNVLPCGLTVHYLQHPGPSTVTGLRIGSGHLDDPPGQEGLAHLTEHMIAGQDEAETGFLGRDWDENRGLLRWAPSSTSMVATCYHHLCASDDEECAFCGLRDLVFCPNLRDVKHHAQILGCERRQSGDRAVERRALAAVFGDQRLSTAASLPDDGPLLAFQLADVRANHDRWYRPANADLVVVSPRPWEELLPILEQAFPGDRIDGKRPVRQPAVVGPPRPGMFINIGNDRRQVGVGAVAALPLSVEPGAVNLLLHLLRTRLMDVLRAFWRVTYTVQANVEHYGVAQILVIGISTSGEQAGRARDETLGAFAKTDWVKEYLEPCRERLLHELDLRLEPTAISLVNEALTELTLCGRTLTHEEVRAQVSTMTDERAAAILKDLDENGLYLDIS
jgi:predicted Zn-dependent peptidase